MIRRSPWAANLTRAFRRPRANGDASAAAEPIQQESAAKEPSHPARGRAAPAAQITLYTVLGMSPAATVAEIGVAYRTRAARLSNSRSGDLFHLKELNTAHRILSDPSARADYDRSLSSGDRDHVSLAPQYQRVSVGLKHSQARPVKRTSSGGASELVALVGVLAISAAAGWMLLNSASVDLSPIRGAGQLLGLVPAQRPTAGDAGAGPRAVLASPLPVQGAAIPIAAQLRDSAISITTAQPRPESTVDVNVSLRREGTPAAGVDVRATVYAATTGETLTRTEPVRTNPEGIAVIPLTIPARPGAELRVEVTALVDGQELPWGLSVTPR